MQENLLGLVEQAGVVGAGGAGFPTHVKLKAQADTVIINGAECEPLLRVDQQLMALQAGDLLDALDLLVEQVGGVPGRGGAQGALPRGGGGAGAGAIQASQAEDSPDGRILSRR